MYNDRHKNISVKIIKEYLEKYYKACMANEFFEGNVLEKANTSALIAEIEAHIENKMIPHLQRMVMSDIKLGGVHDISLSKSKGSILEIDTHFYCSYSSLNMELEKKIGFERPTSYLVEGKCPKYIIEECQKCFMDFCKLFPLSFADKYNPPQILKGADDLLSVIMKSSKTNPLKIASLGGDISAFGYIENADDFKLEVLKFLMESTDYNVGFKNGNIVLYDSFIVDEISIEMNLKRTNTNESLSADICTVDLTSRERNSTVSIDTRFSAKLSKEYGKFITDGVYAECIALLNAHNKKNKKEMSYE